MKLKSNISYVAYVFAAILFTSCGGGSDVSPTTGWAYNDPESGGFEVTENREQETGPGLVLIEGGTFIMGKVQQDVMYDWNNVPRRITIPSFYMDETEVRNVDYREYLHWLRRVFTDIPEVYRKALPDTLVWRRRLAYNEPYVENYFRHPAYLDYPVVGVSWKQADAYCAWRSDRVNENILIQQGILAPDNIANASGKDNFNTDAYLAGLYEGMVLENLPSLNPDQEDRPVRMEDGILLPKYRLPLEAEWEYAALGLQGNTFEERVYSRKVYPWNGHFTRNDQKSDRGMFMANFQRGKGDMMGVAGYLNDNASVPSPVDSYWPNDVGLFCMAGNVNEWVMDVYRPLSFTDVEEFRPFRGNVFQTRILDEEGLPLQETDSLGRVQYMPVPLGDCMNRDNYKRADNINYDDGDIMSSITEDTESGWLISDEGDAQGSARMYDQGGENNKDMATLINDKVRVYKGGSWKDRAYWLSPGARRFLDENKARDDIGFRCSMIRVGSPRGF